MNVKLIHLEVSHACKVHADKLHVKRNNQQYISCILKEEGYGTKIGCIHMNFAHITRI